MNIMVKRLVEDYGAWKSLVSTGNEVRREKGSRGVTVYRSRQDANEVYLLFDWDDAKPYQDYFSLPEVQKALAETGSFEIVEMSECFHLDE